MNAGGSLTWRILLSLAFIIHLYKVYCSESTVNKADNGLKQTIADSGMEEKTRKEILALLELHQRRNPTEINAIEKSDAMFELNNKIKSDDTFPTARVELSLPQSAFNNIPAPDIHEINGNDVINRLVNDVSSNRSCTVSIMINIDISDVTEICRGLIRARRSARKESANQRCRRIPLNVNFRQIGWKWVHSPKVYNAYACIGDCSYPLVGEKQTNHATIQSIVHRNNLHNIGNPSCVPTKLSGLHVVYYSGRDRRTQNMTDMVVEECGCR